MEIERATGPLEVRAEGRTLSGPAIRYGDVSPSHREAFAPGSIALDDRTRWLDLDHIGIRAGDGRTPNVIAWTGGGGLELRDTPEALTVRAELAAIPSADKALAGVASGKYRGFSVEFRPVQTRKEGGIRVIERADMIGLALVGEPSYTQSRVEIRQRSGRTMRSLVPSGVEADCRCIGGDCARVVFEDDLLREMWDDADEVVAGFGSYSESPLASKSSGTLRARMVDGGLEFDIDMPTGTVGDATIAAHEAAGVIVRPHLDRNLSNFTVTDGVARYTRAQLRGVIVSATDQRNGWPLPAFIATPDFDPEEPPATRNADHRARAVKWL